MSAFDNVVKLAKEWQPGELPTELKYRDSLVAFLRDQLKHAQVEKEYRHGGTTIDIYVKQSGFFGTSEVFVELKRNLLQKTQLDRLVGQTESLQPGKNPDLEAKTLAGVKKKAKNEGRTIVVPGDLDSRAGRS